MPGRARTAHRLHWVYPPRDATPCRALCVTLSDCIAKQCACLPTTTAETTHRSSANAAPGWSPLWYPAYRPPGVLRTTTGGQPRDGPCGKTCLPTTDMLRRCHRRPAPVMVPRDPAYRLTAETETSHRRPAPRDQSPRDPAYRPPLAVTTTGRPLAPDDWSPSGPWPTDGPLSETTTLCRASPGMVPGTRLYRTTAA